MRSVKIYHANSQKQLPLKDKHANINANVKYTVRIILNVFLEIRPLFIYIRLFFSRITVIMYNITIINVRKIKVYTKFFYKKYKLRKRDPFLIYPSSRYIKMRTNLWYIIIWPPKGVWNHRNGAAPEFLWSTL